MLKLEGISTVGFTPVELPPMEELLLFPFIGRVGLDDLRKHANQDLRNIIDKVPLRNKSKYVTVNMVTQYLTPETTSAPRANWHFDSDSFHPEDETTIHLLLSECLAVTEFTKNDIFLEQFDEYTTPSDVELFLCKNENLIGESVKTRSNAFTTFSGSRHFHRAIRKHRSEFRFMMRVMESNSIAPTPIKDAIIPTSFVFDDKVRDYSTIDYDYITNNRSFEYPSIAQNGRNIKIYLNKEV